MNTIYLLSGPPRSGKTTIMQELVRKAGVQLISADALEYGLRNIFTGKPRSLLTNIQYTGSADYKPTFNTGGGQETFSWSGTESGVLLEHIAGMLDYYQQNAASVAFEGTEFSPEWVDSLRIPGCTINAAYVGYTDPVHADAVIAHARRTDHDWLRDWLERDDDDETNIRQWIADTAMECKTLQATAKQYGYPFFDISGQSFAEHVSSVVEYFLSRD